MVFISNRNHDAAISPFFEYIYYLQEVIFVLLFIIYYIHFDRVTIRLKWPGNISQITGRLINCFVFYSA